MAEYIYIYTYIVCSFKIFSETFVSKVNGNTKIQKFEFFFNIPTNSFSQFRRFHMLTRISLRPYNIRIWYIRIKKVWLPYVFNFKVKVLMTHYQDIMIVCFICHCTRETKFLKINFFVINTWIPISSLTNVLVVRSLLFVIMLVVNLGLSFTSHLDKRRLSNWWRKK